MNDIIDIVVILSLISIPNMMRCNFDEQGVAFDEQIEETIPTTEYDV